MQKIETSHQTGSWSDRQLMSMNLKFNQLNRLKFEPGFNALLKENSMDSDSKNKTKSKLPTNELSTNFSLPNTDARENIFFSIEQLRDKKIIGYIVIGKFEDYFQVDCWIIPERQKSSYFGESILRISRLIFEEHLAESVVVHIEHTNARAEKFLKEAGFKLKNVTSSEKIIIHNKAAKLYSLCRNFWEHREKPILFVVAGALIDSDSRVLIGKRPEKKPMAGLWEFPGGKLQKGESPETALIRELKEELGVDISESCLAPFTFTSHLYDNFHLIMPLYLCRVWKGRVINREHIEIKWVQPNRLREYPMPPADLPLLPMLQEFL